MLFITRPAWKIKMEQKMGTLENKTANTEKHNKEQLFLLLLKTTYKYVTVNAVPGGYFSCTCECMCAHVYAATSFPLNWKNTRFSLRVTLETRELYVLQKVQQCKVRTEPTRTNVDGTRRLANATYRRLWLPWDVTPLVLSRVEEASSPSMWLG